MASVHERVSARTGVISWRVMFRIDTPDGPVQRQESFKDPESAYAFAAHIDRIGPAAALRVKEAKDNATVGTPTLAQFTADYLDDTSGMLTGVEPGTRRGYERAARLSFLPILGDYPIDAIQKDDIGRWVAWQEKQPSQRRGGTISAKTVKNYHSILSAVLAASVEQGLRKDNPAYRTRLTRGIKREGTFLTPQEFDTLLYFIPDYYQRFVLFLAGTGCRWGEAIALTWGAVDLNGRIPTVRIEKAYKKGETGAPVLKQPKSAMSRRTISLSPDVAAALGTPGPSDALVFPGRVSGGHLWYGRFRTTVWEAAVDKAQDPDLCAKAGLTPLTKRPTIHSLRHTHASWLVQDGVPLPYVQARLGHESINTTVSTYTHLAPDAHVEMAALISKRLEGRTMKQLT